MPSDPHLFVPTGVELRGQGGNEGILFQRVHTGQVEVVVVVGLAVFFSLGPVGVLVLVYYQLVALVLEPGETLTTVACWGGGCPWLRCGSIVFVLLADKGELRRAEDIKKCCMLSFSSLMHG